MPPKVSIVWLNYNSMKNIEVVKSSIEGVCELDYPNFEFIVVDNGSSDGSFEAIKEFLDKKSVNQKIIRLEKNLGFCGGNNVGYKARDPESKYVVLLNNDCIPEKESLDMLVEFMEQNPQVGASQGIIVKLQNEKLIDTAGDFVSELLASHAFLKGEDKSSIPTKPILISYADGCYSIYSVQAIKRTMGDRLFYDEFFAYFDDNFLGLKLWNAGFKVVSIPKVVGKHYRSMSFGVTPFQEYLGIRAHVASLLISNSRYKNILFRNLLYTSFFIRDGYKINFGRIKNINRAINEGKTLAQFLKEKGELIDLYRIPIIKIPVKTSINLILKSIKSKKSLAEEARIYGLDYIKKNIKSYYYG